MNLALPDVPPADPAMYGFLSALRRAVSTLGSQSAPATTTVVTSGGSSAFSERDYKFYYGGVGDGVTLNDSMLATAEADGSPLYVPVGDYKTNNNINTFRSSKRGRGRWHSTDGSNPYTMPANFSYLATAPVSGTTGNNGFWTGDLSFGDGGEWKIVGPLIRTYVANAQYFDPAYIADPAWYTTLSGNSGAQGYLTSGATAGATTITINGAASAEWVGKTAYLATAAGGAALDTLTVASVSGNTVTFTSALTNSYTWSPGTGLTPCIYFSKRTMGTHTYTHARAGGGGDTYAHLARATMQYVPKPSELSHTFMAATHSQYGGALEWAAGTDGTYGTVFESQVSDFGADVAAIGFVMSYNRTNDLANGGGRMWLGTLHKSEAARPIDAGHVLLGKMRVGFDTSPLIVTESSQLTVAAGVGVSSCTVKSATGLAATLNSLGSLTNNCTIRFGDLTDPLTESFTVTGVAGNVVTFSGTTTKSHPVGSYVEFINAGTAIALAQGQRITFNQTKDNINGRSGDPLGVYAALYGNQHGDMLMESGADANGDYITIRYARASPNNGRWQFRPALTQANVPLQMGAGAYIQTASYVNVRSGGQSANQPAIYFGSGTAATIEFNAGLNRWDFIIGGTVVAHVP